MLLSGLRIMFKNTESIFPDQQAPEKLPSLWKRQIQADLKWILESPPLFDGPDGLDELTKNKVEAQDLISSLDSTMTSAPPRRVGLYFESLLDTWLARILKLVMDARHLQVFDSGRTIGEIDFSVRDHQGIRWRFESTIKFYLHHPITKLIHGSSFIGPDPRDSFERKYRHLMARQLPLPVPESAPADHALPISRGILFYHINDLHNPGRPNKANPKHLRGLWLKASEWACLKGKSLRVDRVVHLPKPFWMSGLFNPGLTSQELTLPDAEKFITSHFEESTAPLMMSLRQSLNEIQGEKWRCIIVPDTWPNFV
jgi:hypothetical protein